MKCCRPNRRCARFYPYHAMHHPAAVAEFFFDEVAKDALPTFLQGKARLSEEKIPSDSSSSSEESNAYYVIEMAIPGVQAHHVTIEEKNGELEIIAVRLGGSRNEDVVKTYQDVFFLHPSKADISKLVATTKNGVLTIRIPKKAREVMTIETVSGPPPARSFAPAAAASADTDGDEAMDGVQGAEQGLYVSWDVPGASVSDVAAEFHGDEDEDQLRVTVTKSDKFKSVRTATVAPSIDMTQARAYLQHGVFTLVAPARADAADAADVNAVRTFYATPEEEQATVLPEVASLRIDEATSVEAPTANPVADASPVVDAASVVDAMTVETVPQQDWETLEHADADGKPSAN